MSKVEKIDERLEAQRIRNMTIAPDPRHNDVRDLEKDIAAVKDKKAYDGRVLLQQYQSRRSALIGQLRSEIRVVVDNSEFWDDRILQ